MTEIVIDASQCIVGRVASFAAKQALLGKKVIIVNCQDALLLGNKGTILEEYKNLVNKGGSSLKGPFFPKKDAAKFMKRTIRGMLPYKQERGRSALKRIICYSNLPQDYEKSKMLSLKKPINTSSISLKKMLKEIS